MGNLKEAEGASGPAGVTQAGNVASGRNGKIDTFGTTRKNVEEKDFYELLFELKDYEDVIE